MDEESERFKDVQKLQGNDLGEVSKVIVVLHVDTEVHGQYNTFPVLITPKSADSRRFWNRVKIKVVQF